MKWQTAAAILAAILLGTGAITYTDLFGVLVQLSGVNSTHSGDMYCKNRDCYGDVNVTTTYWRFCFAHYNGTKYENKTLFKKVVSRRTLHINLDNVDNIISTSPRIEVDWLVPARGAGNWRPIKDGDCWERGKVNKNRFVPINKKPEETIKWGVNIGDYIDVDPKWIGNGTNPEIIKGKNNSYLTSKTVTEEAIIPIEINSYIDWKGYEDLKLDELDIRLIGRGLQVKHNYQIDDLIDFYPEKIDRMNAEIERLREMEVREDGETMTFLKEKVIRLKDKYALVILEKESRDKLLFDRNPIGTVYYIDFDGGNDSALGTSITTAWGNITKYTTATVRSAGDIAFVRANMQLNQITSTINFDEDGTASNPIQIIGATVSDTDDTWGDGSDVKPTISFEGTAWKAQLNSDDHWQFKNLIFKNSSHSTGMFSVSSSQGIFFDNCVFKNNDATNSEGLEFTTSSEAHINNCLFTHFKSASSLLSSFGSILYIKNSIFNDSVSGAPTSIQALNGGVVYIKDSNISGSTFGLRSTTGGKIYARNINFSGVTNHHSNTDIGILQAEGINQDVNATFNYHTDSNLDRETSVVRSGGAKTSAKLQPQSFTGNVTPATLTPNYFVNGDFKIWTTPVETNITIYLRGFNWASLPTATELFIETEYLDEATTARRTSVLSDEVLPDSSTWVGFDTVFTPVQEGWAYVTVKLHKFEDTSTGIYVDIKPVVS